ncbi:Ribosomal Pentatricopeptide Repeat Protein 2, NUCLEAR FUSION DEFECTIVE 5 [Hibiscus trionum]|uniref:Ribosomal Pentatricopeptide Repeat Protein 2, NUCLEAR FUSION DEFECTIVE 5 n=1 Tax=Hibiscus trionum TaxID=183268 RepID=A0A9W7IMI9_HIBTR|nr:Ribosomal Pentatricopeptide Repeat Protein 2, NUCLEAR FUSION DEFECTIVE 5 [Hibiscus trionum]
MKLKHLAFRKTINNLSKINAKPVSGKSKDLSTISATISPSLYPISSVQSYAYLQNPKNSKPISAFIRYIHSTRNTMLSYASVGEELVSCDSEDEDDGTVNEFLSRFIWIMRGKLIEVYTDCNKETIDGMLLAIVEKVVEEMEKGGIEQMVGSTVVMPSQDFSEDLWRTVWEVSNMVLEDMEKARKKEKMKQFLQSEEVKEMCRFAGEVGIRGDLLRELRFKWAKEKMEENDFYQRLGRFRHAKQEKGVNVLDKHAVAAEDMPKVASLPKRKGKIKYKMYGLDLSVPKWAEVADKIHERGEMIWPQEPKPISGKCKLVMEKILSLKMEDDPSQLLAEWIQLLQPTRVDWITLLDKLEQNPGIHLKIAELVLREESFQTSVHDYTKLIDAYAKENHIEDAERILNKMVESGIMPDSITATILVHMYSKVGNVDRAKEAFESLRSYGFQPDMKIYNSMIMAYLNAGEPRRGESLLREMLTRDIKPSEDIYMALLRSYSHSGDVNGAGGIANSMQLAGFQPNTEYFSLLVKAYGQAGNPDQARSNFDSMIKLGHKPDDKCTANMIAAYEKKNLLDKGLDLLIQLEKDGFEPGIATYTALLDWFGKLQLVDETEELLGKIAELGEVPPLKVHVSLCDMYSRAGFETKTLQALGVLEARRDELGPHEFERIINALIAGGFVNDTQRIHGIMEAKGFAASEQVNMALSAHQALSQIRPLNRWPSR